jgi:tRNA-dihydrouridine synthase
MDTGLLANILIALLSATFAAGGAYAAVKVELRFLNEKITRNRDDIADMRHDHRDDILTIHGRISNINERITKGGINGG